MFAMVKTLCQRLVDMMVEIVLNVKMKTANTSHRQKCKSVQSVGITSRNQQYYLTFFVPSYSGNGWCSPLYNKAECGWDGGDCMDFNLKYPNCNVTSPSLLGNRFCNGGEYNTEECGWDGGDCIEKVDFRKQNPECDVERPELLGDKICHGGEYNTPECAYDAGDCLDFNAKYPNCNVEYPSLVGNGWCSFGKYDTEECGWDGGDCLLE